MPTCEGENHYYWKGELASAEAKHQWMSRKFGTPMRCEDCQSENKTMRDGRSYYDWANISGKYLRIRSDWKRLCKMCHKKMDYKNVARGERQHSAKLTAAQVQQIRLLYKKAVRKSQRKLAKIFGVSQPVIGQILRREIWKHL